MSNFLTALDYLKGPLAAAAAIGALAWVVTKLPSILIRGLEAFETRYDATWDEPDEPANLGPYLFATREFIFDGLIEQALLDAQREQTEAAKFRAQLDDDESLRRWLA